MKLPSPHASKKQVRILFLNENPLPKVFTQGTIAGKELRLRSAIRVVNHIDVISRPGQSMHDITNSRRGPLEKKITVFHTVPCPYYLGGFLLFLHGLKYCLQHRPSIIECESPHISGTAGVALGLIFRIPVVIELRASYREIASHRWPIVPNSLKKALVNFVLRIILSSATGVIVNSKYYQRQLDRWKIPSTVINPGVQHIKLMSSRWKKHPESHFVIGFMGRLVAEKGGPLLAKAFVLASEQLADYTLHLEIAGTGPQKSQVSKIIASAGLSNSVSFLGWMRSSYALSRWDILVNPNLVAHPLEMVNVEAAYCGVPVICFGNRDVPETVVHLQTGLKVRTQTAEDLAQAIIDIVQNPQLRARLSSNGREFVHRQYSFPQQVKKLLNFYREHQIL